MPTDELPLHFTFADLAQRDPHFAARLSLPTGEGGCWIWTGANQYSGQNRRNRYGRVSRKGKLWLVHRYVWALFHGPAPRSDDVHHSCEVPLCCNPNHLETIWHTAHTELHNAADREWETAWAAD